MFQIEEKYEKTCVLSPFSFALAENHIGFHNDSIFFSSYVSCIVKYLRKDFGVQERLIASPFYKRK